MIALPHFEAKARLHETTDEIAPVTVIGIDSDAVGYFFLALVRSGQKIECLSFREIYGDLPAALTVK